MAKTRCFNLNIPYSIMRLGEGVVEDLVAAGIKQDIDSEVARDALVRVTPMSRRGCTELLRPISAEDYSELNGELNRIRADVSDGDIRIRAYYVRRLCQILKTTEM